MNTKLNLSWWLTFITRVAAVLGLVYETLVDRLHNPTALVVFGGLAGLPDVLGAVRTARELGVSQEERASREERRR